MEEPNTLLPGQSKAAVDPPSPELLQPGNAQASDAQSHTSQPDTEKAGEPRQDPAQTSDAQSHTSQPDTEKAGESRQDPAQQSDLQPDTAVLLGAMEAVLFAMGEAVPLESIAQALGISRQKAEELADLFAAQCTRQDRGLVLNRYEDAVQLSTKPSLHEYLIRIASEPKKPKLTPTLMETLSIIAFRQPVTRMEVENIRGVNSDFAINRLVSFDLVKEVGRKEVPGRPLLFGTTEQFLRSFGIRSVDELPQPDSSQLETFREEAEEEITSRLKI